MISGGMPSSVSEYGARSPCPVFFARRMRSNLPPLNVAQPQIEADDKE